MLGPSNSLISQILWSPVVYVRSPSVFQGPRLPAFCCSRSLGPQPHSVPGVLVSEVRASNPSASWIQGPSPVVSHTDWLPAPGEIPGPHTGPPALMVTSSTLVTRPAPAPPLTHRAFSLPSTPGDCGFWTWQPGPHHGLSSLGPQHACCLHRQPLLLPSFCCRRFPDS